MYRAKQHVSRRRLIVVFDRGALSADRVTWEISDSAVGASGEVRLLPKKRKKEGHTHRVYDIYVYLYIYIILILYARLLYIRRVRRPRAVEKHSIDVCAKIIVFVPQ